MQALILGEGPTDLGRFDADGMLQLPGVLPILVERLLRERAPGMPIDFRVKEFKHIRQFKKRGVGPSVYGFANKLRALLGIREGREADCVIAVTDRDGPSKTDKIEELNRGREQLRSANKPCAVGVAVEEIEAWLLADEQALRAALNNDEIVRQPDPESLTSRNEHSDNNPKGRLERLIANSAVDSDFTTVYARIASAVNMQVVEIRCPQGFAPFAGQVRELTD